jgi:methanogenic corrinoid protein MtbC1
MGETLEQLVNKAQEELVQEELAQEELYASSESALAYEKAKETLIDKVNGALTRHPHLEQLIGLNPIQMMYDNHRDHANFMVTVLKLNAFEMLVRIVPWVYRTYHRRGFSYHYFLEELTAWQEAVKITLDERSAEEIIPVYGWLLAHHEDMIKLSEEKGSPFFLPVSPEWQKQKDRFLAFLLKGDFDSCLRMFQRVVHGQEDLRNFYLRVVQPALYEVGVLWEEGKISVAEEHLATAIVGGVMASIYTRVPRSLKSKKKVVLTATPHEFHEVGCRMIADLLEAEGWNVMYLGANTPQDELLKLLRKNTPRILGISVTMPFNLPYVKEIITRLGAEKGLQEVRIMVGGVAFNMFPGLWHKLGAHGWAEDGQAATALVRQWMDET